MDSNNQANQESPFAAFTPELFVAGRPWERIQRILNSNRGGNYGLSGPRGAGKSWQIQRAVAHADDHSGLGVWFPSPSEYDPKAFLSALSEVVAQRFIDYYVNLSGVGSERAWRLRHRTLLQAAMYAVLLTSLMIGIWISPIYSSYALFVAFPLAVGVAIAGTRHVRKRALSLRLPKFALTRIAGYWIPVVLVIFASLAFAAAGAVTTIYTIAGVLALCAIVMCLFLWILMPNRESAGWTLFSKALEVRTLARYSIALKESGELSASASRYGASAGWKRAKETTLIERQASLSSLVHSFRQFASLLDDFFKGPIVIGIDELDKLEDADQLKALLRDVKGVFDLKGIHYFVSLSDEAASAFQLWSGGRNEFHSSFYQIINVGHDQRGYFNTVMERRGLFVPELTQSTILVASCGVPREFIRLVESLSYDGTIMDAHQAQSSLDRVEIEAFRLSLLANATETKNEDGLLAGTTHAMRCSSYDTPTMETS